jgi:hypothetical protein
MKRPFACALLWSALLGSTASAVTIGQIDTFSSGTQGWFAGGVMGQFPPTPPHVELGGPGGAADPFLVITADRPGGPGSRLTAMNATQWAGNYLASGISGISLDLINLGPTELTIRLLFEDPSLGPPLNEAVSNVGIVLPVGSGWINGLIPIGISDLTALEGTVASALSGTTVIRIINAPTLGLPAQAMGVLGVDNIQAVPEPQTFLAIAIGLLLIALQRSVTHRT